MLVHACYREGRRERSRRRIVARVQAIDPVAPDATADVAMRDQLERAFVRLAPDQRALIVLHYYLDLPLAETADILGLPVGTAKTRLRRTTQAMRATLDADARTGLRIGTAT